MLVSPPVSAVPGDRRCLEFWWSTSSQSSAAVLSVRVLRYDGVLVSVAWNQSNTGAQGAWTQATVSLVAEGPFQVRVTWSVSLPDCHCEHVYKLPFFKHLFGKYCSKDSIP